MRNSAKRKIYLGLCIFGILIFPLVLLLVSNRIQFVDFEYATKTIFTQISGWGMFRSILVFVVLTVSTLALAIFSMTFLFEINVHKKTRDAIKDKWYWKILKQVIIEDKHGWHIYLGYFLAILALNSLITPIFLETQSTLQPITLYQSYVVTAIMASIVLFIARLLSKFPLQIAGTNIGMFLVLVYISQLIYAVISTSYIPLEQLVNFVTYRVSDAEGIFMLYGSTVLLTSIVATADYFLVAKIWKKPL